MQLWTSCEGTGSFPDKANQIFNGFEQKFNDYINENSYGNGLKEWSVIFIIAGGPLDPGFTERTMVKRSSQDMDFRLRVDFEAFKKGNTQKRTFLMHNTLLRSLDILAAKKVKDFDLDSLRKDFEACADLNGWNVEPDKAV